MSGPVSPTSVGFRQVLAVREFRGLWFAQLASLVGDQLAKLALAILVYRHTDNALLAALAYAVAYLPALVSGPLIGLLADTKPRRTVMITCDLMRAVVVGLMCLPGVPTGVLIGLLFVVSAAEPPFNAARSALLPDVLDGEAYPIGQSLGSLTQQVTQVVGFGVGGLLIGLLSARGALAVDAVTFLVSAALLRLYVSHRTAPAVRSGQSLWSDSVAGAAHVLSQPLLRRLIGLTALCFGLSIATEGLAVSYAAQLGRGDVATGVLTAAMPLGSAVGLALVAKLPAARRLPMVRLLGVLWPLPLVVTILQPPVALTAALWALTGALSAFQLLANVLFARNLRGEIRGRAFAFAQSLLIAVQGVGLLVTGAIAQWLNPATAVALAGVAGVVLSLPLAGRLRAPDPSQTPGEHSNGSSQTPVRRSTSVAAATAHAAQVSPAPVRVAPPTASSASRARLGAVYVFTLAVAGLAIAGVYFGLPRNMASSAPVHVPWWVLALIFAATGYFAIHFQRGRDSVLVVVSQVPIILGLYFTGPVGLLGAYLLGNGLMELRQRRPPMKFVVNRAASCVEVLTATFVFGALQTSASSSTGRSWVAGYAAIILSEVAGLLFVLSVRRIFDRQLHIRTLLRPFAFALLVALAAGSVALLAVTAMYANAAAGILLLLVGILVVGGLHAYAELQERHQGLGRLYAFQERLQALTPAASALLPVLEHTRDLLVAEMVELELPPDDDGYVRVLSVRADTAPSDVRQEAGSAAPILPPDGLSVHLRSAERSLGTLRARHRLGRIRGFRTSDLQLLETLGAHVSDAMERGTLIGQLEEAATHDPLTGLLTLHELMSRLDEELLSDAPFVIVLLDVSRLQDVNESLGHDAGDALLKTVAGRLLQVLPAGALAGRSGGGEFAVAIPGLRSYAAPGYVEQLAEAVSGLVQVLGVTVDLRSRLGWAAAPHDGGCAAVLVRRADLALAAAKRDLHRTARYRPNMEVDGLRRLRLVNDLREAIANDQLDVLYQPLVTPRDGRVIGAEALARWSHPELGPLPPDEFIVVAEQSGLIGDLTTLVLDKALAQTRAWQDEGRDLRIAVNLSARCLTDMGLPGRVLDLLARYRLDPSRLTLEVTETSVAEDPTRALAVLERLRGLGIRLSIDDFGTGYSSLASLKRFPVQEVKLDRQFLADLDVEQPTMEAATDIALLGAVVTLGHSLRLEIVAEGIETVAAYERLRDLGVDVLQGFLMGRPGAGCVLPRQFHVGDIKDPLTQQAAGL